jgi:hypothetical protein
VAALWQSADALALQRLDSRRGVQGVACLALAKSLKNRADELPDSQAKEAEKLRQESEVLFERATMKYAEVKTPFSGAIGDQAKSELFELRNLSICPSALLGQCLRRWLLGDHNAELAWTHMDRPFTLHAVAPEHHRHVFVWIVGLRLRFEVGGSVQVGVAITEQHVVGAQTGAEGVGAGQHHGQEHAARRQRLGFLDKRRRLEDGIGEGEKPLAGGRRLLVEMNVHAAGMGVTDEITIGEDFDGHAGQGDGG